MKCPHPNCGHNIVEKAAKFCSECGMKLSVQPANTQDTRDQPKSLIADSESAPPVDGKESNKSPKRPNDETISNPKKKKKKRKKNKKKKDGTLSSDHSDLSHVSMGDTPGKKTTSDSESSDNPMDETPDSLQDGSSSLESQPSSLAANVTAAPPEDTQVTPSKKTAATAETRTGRQSEEAPGKPDEGESNAPKSIQDQTLETAPADTPTQHPASEDSKSTTSQSGSGKGTKATDPKDQKTDRKNSKNKKDTTATKQPTLDQNANVEPNVKQTGQNKQKGKSQQDVTQKPTAATGQKIFGPQTRSKADNTGSSVDPEGPAERMVVQQSESGQDSTATQTSDADKGSKDDSKDNTESGTPAVPQPKRPNRNMTITGRDRLTVYFHAVLSKDFKFDPNEDRIFIRAGLRIGTWEEDAVELCVTRDLGEHGFLVEGCLQTSKTEAESVSIPYKYVVYRNKKKTYEYEFIYKLDSTHNTTNRCLFVKPRLVSDDGDWHQYDDIICIEPSKNMLQRLRDKIWPEQRKSLIQGREIAGKIMLDTIFDLLRSWTDANLRTFRIQLNQFFQVYGEPFVYEEKQKKWYSLNYDEDDVRKMLKEFMLTKVIPQLLKDRDRKMHYIQDPVRAAVIMLCVWREYRLKLESSELLRLCSELCLPKLDKDAFLQYWTQFSQDVAIFKNLLENLVCLIQTVKTVGTHRWILVLPLLHLLRGTIKPYEVPTCVNWKYGSSWAGLQGLDIGTPAYMSSQDTKALMNLMKSHSHLMEVDALLVRSCLFLMPCDNLVECVTSINTELLDILYVFNNKAPLDITHSTVTTVSDILKHIQGHLIEEKYSHFTEAYGRGCLATAVKLLEKLCGGVKPSYTQNYPEVSVACTNLVALVSDFVYCNQQQETQEGEKEQRYAKDLISQARKTMRDWISLFFGKRPINRGWSLRSGVETTAEIEMWNNIISINFKDEVCTKEWRQTFTMDFEGKYKQESALDQIEFYCKKIEELRESHPHVAASIEKCALEAVTSLCQTKSEGKLFERFEINWKFGNLISAIIHKSWPRDHQGNYQEDEEVVLQHLLSWTAAKNIFQLHGTEEKLIQKLSPDARSRIAIAISSFTAINNQLVHGNIKISLLDIILKRKDAFLDLLKIDCLSENEQFKDNAKMRRLLQCRQDEVKAVYHEKALVDILLTMSHNLEEHMTVDVADMDGRQQVNIEIMLLNHFMEVHQFDQMPSDMTGVVTYFHLEKEIRNMAEVLYTFRDSYIFKVCWEKQAKLLATEEMDDDNPDERGIVDIMATSKVIHDDIFEPCFADYTDIYTRLKNGSIRLEEVNQLFRAYKGKYEELAHDLDIMCRVDKSIDKQWIHSRVHQIEQYHELHLAVTSAEIIMMVKETLLLQGDFRVLETLTEVNHADFQSEQLSRIDNDLMQAKMVLVDITEPRRLCLQELGLRRNFVKWVKDALEDINELKVFVDLASISAGENDMEVDRVACFHDAVLGYSSMLYELKPESGFHAFKEVLKKLWRALENDGNLPKKLRDSARHLEWLKTVKDCHGSVELSSLSLASAINKKGIYLISAQNVKKLSLDTALRLQIPEAHDEGCQMRCYSLEDLRELQNKLMLMSGKGDQGQNEVDLFAEVFASVQRLAEAFIALYIAGNPLFRHWEAQINCSLSSKEPSIMVDFNLGSVVSDFSVEGSIEEQLPEFCRKMEKCLDYWRNFVDKQRSQHYYLNYYTAEQIVYLCSKLSQQNVTNVEEQVLMMLSFVKPNCTASDLRQVWHALQYEILTQPEAQNEDIEFQTFVVVPRTELGDPDFTSELDPLPSLVEQENGLQEFDLIWNAYMKDMKNFLPHILDIKNLGRLLEVLANKEDESDEDESEKDISDDNIGSLIMRQLPEGLATGNPNLIVCPHVEVLTSCISIYMSSEDETLPTYDEVLLCNSSTPYEQVELFFRRCLSTGYRGQKIYSLLYGDLLTYDVSSKVENFFQRMKMQSRKDYRLVIICSSEREHAYLPSTFSQYRLHIVPQEQMARIQTYLHKHFVVPADQCSAAAAFKDRLCVGVVSSKRAGVGKSLYIKRLYEKLKHSTKKPSMMKCIRLIEPNVDENVILQSLLNSPERKELMMFHFDITSSVQKGLHEFLFKLLVLRYLMDSEGKTWKCSNKQLYVIEILEPTVKSTRNASRQAQTGNSTFTDVFPNIFCRPPKDVLMLEMKKQGDPTIVSPDDPLMDDEEFRSAAFQRPYQYLTRFHNHNDLDVFTYRDVEGSHVECLQMLLMHCGIMDPSWAELRNFAWFLNLQLKDCETSVFCDPAITGDTLTGFKTFVVDFMILMAKDFATPSLSISDQSPGRLQMDLTGVRDEDLAPFLIRKRWETEPHPYIFFNDDHVSMTFIGFHLHANEQNSVDAIEPKSGRVIKKNVMTRALYEGLKLQRVPFNMDFDDLPRGEKIERICNVLGIQWPLDPDETYELTTDNILKMLAIHMRFRCGIPVIIMGETGCGKTRLIKFLCELRRTGVATENMKLVKVHGGTTSEMIYTKVREAEDIASTNKQEYGFDSVLFFDEANTTEAISSIKEVLCDKTVKGESLTPNSGLQIIAACNPYRKHTDEMIQRLESAGLGYRVRAEETDEKLGSIPLRQLVYRVQALPPSMIPLVWDFGQLNDHTEKIYILQIVQRVVENKAIDQSCIKWITDVLSASQKYMRTKQDECSFVSLRDVERCMQSFVWFYENHVVLFAELEEFESKLNAEKNERHQRQPEVRHPVLWSLVMAIGVCYHACLENKDKYRQKISKSLPPGYSPAKVMQEISLMQDLLLRGVPMGDTIARNSALKENVFMMVICIELRIPLFLVGKPGSSKSLSKTLVADAMQGQAAHSDLYKRLKQVHLVSFQCSPHSTPEGIINTFKQCGRFQEGKNLDEYISVVVLDEIGLAEDSPKMPLKTLHPLLEEGCIDDEPLPHKKVGFIGISNWALDPAKMNRGIFVSRGDPDERELVKSAEGICKSDGTVLERVRHFFQPFARAYLNICRKQGKGFFGLRDYYSLIKMIFAVAKASKRKPTAEETVKAVLRNFSGRDDVDAVAVFTKRLQIAPNLENINAIGFVRENIQAVGQEEECRYLLVLTKNYAALQILQQTFFSESQPEIIFGSSFPKDQEYTQICRNINRVKICMETGQTVVLLNLQNLYESLYDALNQYYVSLGGQKYVDLGLGTHRVKCRVHKDFRLIVIEEREVVYKQFPIPLINRLEKHYLDIHTVLKTEQKRMVDELEKWVSVFVSLSSQHAAGAQTYKYKPPDVFIGYHSDTCASVVLQVIEKQKDSLEISDPERRVLDEAKLVLLRCATPDSVVRLDCTGLPKVESEYLAKVYFEEQNSSCLTDFILAHTRQEVHCNSSFTEVTTFSRLLTASDLEPLEQMLHGVELFSLQQFDTEHSFLKKIRNFITAGSSNTGPCNKILIIQCDFDEASHSANLIASAKYSSINEVNKITQESTGSKVFVYFITRLPRVEGGTSYIGFHGGPWRSAHIDDLRRSKDIVSDIKALQNMTISEMFETKMSRPEDMEVDDMYTENEQEEAELEENGMDNAVDTTALVRSCVQSAVGMLRDQVESGFRSTRRVEILLTLLSDNDSLKGEFLQTVKRRLHSLLATHDGSTYSSIKSNWVIKEASNIDALQEGGTFRHTLWKRVQAVVIPLLAQLVSVIDCDQNLNILLDRKCDESVKRLWLDIFGSDKLLEIPHLTLNHNSETRTILVQNYIAQYRNMSCSMPFSWRIKNFLEELWVHALQHEGHTQRGFDEFFWKTPLGRYIEKAEPEMQSEFFQRYLQDFISMTMNVTCQNDLELLRGALNCCVNELRLQLNATDTATSLSWVHAAYHEFKNRLQNLSRMICIEPQVTQDLLKNPLARDRDELVLDVYAAFACVEYLEPGVLDTDAQRQAWLRRVKKLQVPIELVCSEDSVRCYGERSKAIVCRVQAGWNRIFSLSLFVEHMLLGIEKVEQKLTPLVLEHTKGLGQILETNSDLKTQQAFEAVIGLLKTCKDGAIERIFRFGATLCPVCMGDPQDPVGLPCEHIYCMACIKQWLGPGQMYCPLCIQPVPDNFPLVPSDAIRILINQQSQFRKQCNAFFIDLVTTVCFKDNSPPSSVVILHLLSFLMVEANPVPILRGRNPQILTKVLSPFDDSVDKNPVVRSVVLKLLLKYSFEEVKGYLQQHLMAVEQSNILEKTDKTELYLLYINCLEDSMFERLQFRSIADQQVCLQDESAFLTDYLQSHGQSAEEATVEYLQQVARVRMDLDMAVSLIMEKLRTTESGKSGTTAFLTSVMNLCGHSGNNWYRVYLIRKICSQFGVEFVQKLLTEVQTRWLFPEEVLEKSEEATPIDQYLVCGEDYKTIRNAVEKGVMEAKVDELDRTCEGCRCSPQRTTVYLLLALYREVTTLYREANASFHPKPEQLEVLGAYIQTSKFLASPEVKAFAQALVTNRLGPLSVRPGTSGAQCVLVDLTIHLAVVLLCGNQGILAPMQQLAMAPASMQAAFLPTMPEDKLAGAQQALGPLRWYICPNGHPCTIGECGQPMQTSKCVDCGVEIGGNNHKPVPGFQVVQLQGDRTQTGHILGDPSRRDNPDMLDTKSISPVPFTVVRMLTHMAMLLGAGSHLQSVSAIIKPPVSDPGAFLLAHLEEDMKHLIRTLGKGTDDTVSAVHLLISSLLEPQQPQTWPVPYNNQLSTKVARNGWEMEVSNAIITPQLKLLDGQLKKVNTFIRADSRISANLIMKLVFSDPRHFLASFPQKSLIHGSVVWSCREKVSLLSLTHIVEQNDGRDTLPVLWRFLHKEVELRLVKNLPDILTLQRDLVKKFQNITELTCGTIAEFLQSQKAVSLKAWYETYVRIFLTTWNQLRVSLATNGEIKIPAEFCQEDLNLESDFKVLLPRRQGPGLCSTALVSYLIALHNDLVYCVDKHTREETSYKVSPADLTDLHVIRYELDRDLMPLVLSNTQYSIERGQETLHEYDLPKIQQQIVSRFLLGKPLITLNGIPTLVNRHDRNYEIILKDVKAKVKQEPLQTLTLFAVVGELHSYSEVFEALSTLEVALGFLAMTGGEPHIQLSCYLEEVLQMENQMAPHILKTMSMCCLQHCVALWQLLASLKSENMLRLKRDPFVGVSEKYKQALGEDEHRLLIGFFSKNNADTFLLEMHEFLVLVLKKPNAPDTYRPDWGLKEALVSYMERKDLDVPPDVEELFPEEICLSQYVEAWKFIVAFKQERGQRQ
ncbi:E3 ubiquitin-protein ligase rnf213-alpha [Enoplosus armatus]|uniref:E3 ubiquitin-protein ligase rnf213-alpha n=1 Tax=Enoplosus armatus TaxID=215367 RepID=UPI003993D32E